MVEIPGKSQIIFKSQTNEVKTNDSKNAELEKSLDLLHHAESDNLIKTSKTKEAFKKAVASSKALQKAGQITDALLNKAQVLINKNKTVAGGAIQTARSKSKTFDKAVSLINDFISYVAKTDQVAGRLEVVQYTRPPAIFGVWVVIITIGVGGIWASVAPIAKAAQAQGKIVLENNKTLIKIQDGGLIEEILVKEGDVVKKDQVLIKLDKILIKAKYDAGYSQYLSTMAENDRLKAQRDNLDHIIFREELLKNVTDPEIEKLMQVQEKIFSNYKDHNEAQIAIMKEDIKVTEENITAVNAQKVSNDTQIKIISEQLDTARKLLANGNFSKFQLNELESKFADLQSRKIALNSELIKYEENIIQANHKIKNEATKMLIQAVTELKKNQDDLENTRANFKMTEESLNRTEIKSPIDGIVNNMTRETIGSLLHPNMDIMEIIPQNMKFYVEAMVSPDDIDVVRVGQVARITLSAFKARIVPVLDGKVIVVSPDLVVEQRQNLPPYYRARIEIDEKALQNVKKLKKVELYPGMNAAVMIETGTRTLMQYLLDPVTQTFNRSLREE